MQKIDTKELAPIKAKATKAFSFANELVIKTDDDESKAVAELSYINTTGDNIKEKKEAILRPLLDATAATRDLFRPLEENVSNAVKVIKQKLLEYHKAKEAKAAKETAAIAARVEKGTLKENTAVTKLNEIKKAEKNISTKEGSVTYKTVRKVRILDVAKIPDSYYDLNEVRVRKDALAGVAIPGVEVYEDKEINNIR